MSIKTVLDAVVRKGTVPAQTNRKRVKEWAKVWLQALIAQAQENPEDFAEEGVSLPPWSVFYNDKNAAGRNKNAVGRNMNAIAGAMADLLPEGYTAESTGTCITLRPS